MAGHSLIGRKLGKYEIVEFVGQGGMATVFRGYQADIDRYVAIKVLPPHPGQDSQFVERFQQEAKTIARLQHPHILTIFDYGTTEEGIIYLVMPFVSGGSLRDIMKNQPMNPQEIARILWNIAAAVDYAHRQKIIHRDIKPDNILLDEDVNPLLSDFGIAKLLEGNMQFTASGGFLGTPAYMAPEQGRGLANIDGRADIYALGVVVFEMLTGSHPYEAETPMMVMFKHVSDPVPSLRDVNSIFSTELDQVLQKALAKMPEDRYTSATAFAQAFQNAIGNTTDTPYIYRTRTTTSDHTEVPTTYGSAATSDFGADNAGTVIMTSATGVTQPAVQTTVLQGVIPDRRNNTAVYVGVVVLLLLLGAAAAYLFSQQNSDDEDGERAAVSVSSASLLAAPDRNAAVLGRALEGEPVEVLGQFADERGERYYFVSIGGQEGWMVQQQLTVPASISSAAPMITPVLQVAQAQATETESLPATAPEADAVTEAVAETENAPTPLPTVPNNGSLIFRSSAAPGDTIALTLRDLAGVEGGETYHAWLFDVQEGRWLSLGQVPTDVFGEGVITFTSSEGETLYQLYDAVVVSVETEAVDREPAGRIAYSGVMSPAISATLAQLFTAWTPDDADLNPRGFSLLDIANREYAAAEDHALFSVDAAQDGFAAGVRTHAEHVYNILHGTEEDINGDNSRSNNPSNLKIGLLHALEAMNTLLIDTTTAEGMTPTLQAQVVNVQTCVQNALQWAEDSAARASELSSVDSVDTATVDEWYAMTVMIMEGADANESGAIEPVEGECGLSQISTFAIFMSQMEVYAGIIPALEASLEN